MLTQENKQLIEENYDEILKSIKIAINSKNWANKNTEELAKAACSFIPEIASKFNTNLCKKPEEINKNFINYVSNICVKRLIDEFRKNTKTHSIYNQIERQVEELRLQNPEASEQEIIALHNQQNKKKIEKIPAVTKVHYNSELMYHKGKTSPSGYHMENDVDWRDNKEYILSQAKKELKENFILVKYVEKYVIPKAEGNDVSYQTLSDEIGVNYNTLISDIKKNEYKLKSFFDKTLKKCGMLN